MKRGSASELRPYLGQGAPWRARVGQVRSLAFLNILLSVFLLTRCAHESKFGVSTHKGFFGLLLIAES